MIYATRQKAKNSENSPLAKFPILFMGGGASNARVYTRAACWWQPPPSPLPKSAGKPPIFLSRFASAAGGLRRPISRLSARYPQGKV
jgi:hypothetical protein